MFCGEDDWESNYLSSSEISKSEYFLLNQTFDRRPSTKLLPIKHRNRKTKRTCAKLHIMQQFLRCNYWSMHVTDYFVCFTFFTLATWHFVESGKHSLHRRLTAMRKHRPSFLDRQSAAPSKISFSTRCRFNFLIALFTPTAREVNCLNLPLFLLPKEVN